MPENVPAYCLCQKKKKKEVIFVSRGSVPEPSWLTRLQTRTTRGADLSALIHAKPRQNKMGIAATRKSSRVGCLRRDIVGYDRLLFCHRQGRIYGNGSRVLRRMGDDHCLSHAAIRWNPAGLNLKQMCPINLQVSLGRLMKTNRQRVKGAIHPAGFLRPITGYSLGYSRRWGEAFKCLHASFSRRGRSHVKSKLTQNKAPLTINIT